MSRPAQSNRRYRVRHETSYHYAADVVHSHHLLHLVPRPAPYQQCLEHEILITPENHRRVNELDAFGNPMVRVELAQPHRELCVVSQMQIEVHARPAVPADTTYPWEKVRDSFAYHGAWPSRDQLEAARFRHESPHVRLKQSFTDFSAACFPSGRPLLECAVALSTKLHAEIQYVPGATNVSTSPTEVLETHRGVCQDFAHLMISCLRSRGLPARYVSGYLRTNATQAGTAEKLVGDALDRNRSDQRLFRGNRSHRGGLGPGLRRRFAATRRDSGRRRSQALGDGAGRADGR
jgi:transglutaminase-like putative cysteine protease